MRGFYIELIVTTWCGPSFNIRILTFEAKWRLAFFYWFFQAQSKCFANFVSPLECFYLFLMKCHKKIANVGLLKLSFSQKSLLPFKEEPPKNKSEIFRIIYNITMRGKVVNILVYPWLILWKIVLINWNILVFDRHSRDLGISKCKMSTTIGRKQMRTWIRCLISKYLL